MSLYRCERCHFLREVHFCPVCKIMDDAKKPKEERLMPTPGKIRDGKR